MKRTTKEKAKFAHRAKNHGPAKPMAISPHHKTKNKQKSKYFFGRMV
jgi:hypothetical protein